MEWWAVYVTEQRSEESYFPFPHHMAALGPSLLG